MGRLQFGRISTAPNNCNQKRSSQRSQTSHFQRHNYAIFQTQLNQKTTTECFPELRTPHTSILNLLDEQESKLVVGEKSILIPTEIARFKLSLASFLKQNNVHVSQAIIHFVLDKIHSYTMNYASILFLSSSNMPD